MESKAGKEDQGLAVGVGEGFDFEQERCEILKKQLAFVVDPEGKEGAWISYICSFIFCSISVICHFLTTCWLELIK